MGGEKKSKIHITKDHLHLLPHSEKSQLKDIIPSFSSFFLPFFFFFDIFPSPRIKVTEKHETGFC